MMHEFDCHVLWIRIRNIVYIPGTLVLAPFHSFPASISSTKRVRFSQTVKSLSERVWNQTLVSSTSITAKLIDLIEAVAQRVLYYSPCVVGLVL